MTFAEGVSAWESRLGLARDVVRQELVARQLAAHLPPPAAGTRVLDVGCGQGTQAVRLAGQGYRVTGVDPSARLLERARSSGADVVWREGTLEEPGDLAELGGPFDVVCCHGVLMYLPDLAASLAALVRLAAPGGLVSVLTRNRAGIALRAGMSGDWLAALRGFDARTYDNRLGLQDLRADEPDEVVAAFERLGATVEAWYGVRLFTDHWGDRPPPADLADLLAVEEDAGRREPYRRLTALTHVLARVR